MTRFDENIREPITYRSPQRGSTSVNQDTRTGEPKRLNGAQMDRQCVIIPKVSHPYSKSSLCTKTTELLQGLTNESQWGANVRVNGGKLKCQ